MLTFFKINDPYRVLFVFLGLILVWIPGLLSNPLTLPELNWMITGERLGGGNILYRDLWTEVAPFSAGVYWVLDIFFGRSQAAYMILALVLISFQCVIFNRILLKNDSFRQPNYVPAVIYASLSILSFDFMTLSPQLMATTFLLLAMDFAFTHIMARVKQDEKIQYIGLFLLAATLFYFPYFIFLIGFLLVLLIFTGTVARRFFLILYGYLLPLVLTGIYYWYREGLEYFWNQFLTMDFFQNERKLMSSNSMMLVAGMPLTFIIFSFIRLFGRTRYTNFQITLIQVVLLLFIFAGLGYWISPTKPPHALIIFLPFAAFLISHFFMLIKSKFFSEMAFLSFLVLIILWNFGTRYQFSPTSERIDYSDLKVSTSRWDEKASGKNIMILTPDINVLNVSKLASPFLNWRVSKEVFENPDVYENIILVYKSLEKEKPDLIIDPQGVMGEFFKKMPGLESKYNQAGEFWIRRN